MKICDSGVNPSQFEKFILLQNPVDFNELFQVDVKLHKLQVQQTYHIQLYILKNIMLDIWSYVLRIHDKWLSRRIFHY